MYSYLHTNNIFVITNLTISHDSSLIHPELSFMTSVPFPHFSQTAWTERSLNGTAIIPHLANSTQIDMIE